MCKLVGLKVGKVRLVLYATKGFSGLRFLRCLRALQRSWKTNDTASVWDLVPLPWRSLAQLTQLPAKPLEEGKERDPPLLDTKDLSFHNLIGISWGINHNAGKGLRIASTHTTAQCWLFILLSMCIKHFTKHLTCLLLFVFLNSVNTMK